MKHLKKTLIAAMLALPTGALFAATTDIKFISNQGTVALSTSFVPGGEGFLVETVDYMTGPLQFQNAAGASFAAYCVEVAQDHANSRRGLQTYAVGSFSGTQASLLQGLFSSSFSSLLNGVQQAAFQTAIWEITHESAGAGLDVGLGQGHFFVKSLGSADATESQAFRATVNGFLGIAANYAGPDLYTLTKLSNASYQDLLTVSAVPEPSGVALLALGLGCVGLTARRRTPRPLQAIWSKSACRAR